MARPRKPEAPQHTSLIASAVRLPVVRRNQVVTSEAWQAQAWRYYDRVGELRFIANWVGNVMSRAELRVVVMDGRVDTVQDSGPGVDALHAYFDGEQGQAEMLRLTGVHLTVAGECYHVWRSAEDGWSVLAAGKVRQQGKIIQADFGEGFVALTAKDLAIRVWSPHPMDPLLADSPTRASLSTLAEIEHCDLSIQATLTSRLAGNGILFVPQDITFPVPEGMDPAASTADVFMAALGEAMMTPIETPGDASAVVPIVVTAPGESLNQIRHVTFWTEVDANVKEMREAAVKRLALGMDIPPEVLLGMAETNHWNAWLVDEASVKAHTEPRLAVVANAITTAYLRPALTKQVDDLTTIGVVGDTSNIRLRPNRSKEALELWDRGELGSEALLRETGFEPEDRPDKREFQEWLLRKIALGSTSPEQTQAAIVALGTDLPIVTEVIPGEVNKPMPDNLQPRRSLDEHPTRDIPEQAASLMAACDVLVYRALERAGNRLRSATQFTGKVTAADVYLEVAARTDSLDKMLDGSWSCADRVLSHLTDDVDTLVAALDGYTRHLLATQTPHTRERMAVVLASVKVA
jgi:hypothetical protein